MKIALFGNEIGIPQLLKAIPERRISAVIAASDRPKALGLIKSLTRRKRIKFMIQPAHNKTGYEGFVKALKALRPDFIVVNSYSMKLREDILAIPRNACVNVHGGLLPQYRGCNPIQWALLNGETETGVTMHYMTPDFDAGDIIARRKVPIRFEDTWLDIQNRISKATERLFREEMDTVLAGKRKGVAQDKRKARYFHRRKPEDGRIHWNEPIIDIYNRIRALVKPHPGVFYFLNGKKIIIDKYITVPEVAALKYSIRPKLASKEFRLYPACQNKTIMKKNSIINFNIVSAKNRRVIGICGLAGIDYARKKAKMRFDINKNNVSRQKYIPEIEKLLRIFAGRELKIKNVSDRI